MHLKCNIPLVPIEIFQYGLFQCRLIFGIIVSTRFYKITYNKNHLERGDFIISPFHEKWLYSRSSYLRYNQVTPLLCDLPLQPNTHLLPKMCAKHT